MRWRRAEAAAEATRRADADGDNGSGAPYFHPDFLGGAGRSGGWVRGRHRVLRPRVIDAKDCAGMSSHKLARTEKMSNASFVFLS